MPITPPPAAVSRGARASLVARLTGVVLLLAVNASIFLAVDWLLVKLDLLAPPLPYGLSDLGFGYPGVRTSAKFGAARANGLPGRLTIAMVGDSHSQLRFDNPLDSHEFVLESALRADGIPVDVVSAGRGRYSPLQEYLLFMSTGETIPITEPVLRKIAREPRWDRQRAAFEALLLGK